MKLTHAIIESSKGEYIISEKDEEGVRHLFHPKLLDARSIGGDAAVFKSGVIPKHLEKGEWEVYE